MTSSAARPGEGDASPQGARIAALFGATEEGRRSTPPRTFPTTRGFISVRVPRLPRLVLLVLGSAIFGFFARRRWWLVLIPIAIGAFFGSAVDAASGFVAPAAGAAGLAVGILLWRLAERRRRAELDRGNRDSYGISRTDRPTRESRETRENRATATIDADQPWTRAGSAETSHLQGRIRLNHVRDLTGTSPPR